MRKCINYHEVLDLLRQCDRQVLTVGLQVTIEAVQPPLAGEGGVGGGGVDGIVYTGLSCKHSRRIYTEQIT